MKKEKCSTSDVVEVLTRVQRRHRADGAFLVWEDRDWLVVLQWMQDYGLFKINPERPPFAEFAHWVDANVSLYLTECSRPAMSVAYKALNGARYPWKNTQMSPNILFRWRAMYQILNKLWEEVSSTRSLPEKARSLHETASDE